MGIKRRVVPFYVVPWVNINVLRAFYELKFTVNNELKLYSVSLRATERITHDCARLNANNFTLFCA